MGTFKAELSGIQLQKCCHETLEFIRVKLDVGKFLERVLIPAVFISLFIGTSKGSALTTATSIYNTDWEMLVKATIGTAPITKASVRKLCDNERYRHDGKLQEFWNCVYECFL